MNVLREEHGAAIVPRLDKGNFGFADPDGVTGTGIIGNEVRFVIPNVEDPDLGALGMRVERV